jgi:hypothetical protein
VDPTPTEAETSPMMVDDEKQSMFEEQQRQAAL